MLQKSRKFWLLRFGLLNYFFSKKNAWLRPTFPVLRFGASIIGANSFQDPVRYEKGWFQVASITRRLQLYRSRVFVATCILL